MKRNACELLIAFTKYCIWEFGEAVPTDSQIYDYFIENEVAKKYYDPKNLIDSTDSFFQKLLEHEPEETI